MQTIRAFLLKLILKNSRIFVSIFIQACFCVIYMPDLSTLKIHYAEINDVSSLAASRFIMQFYRLVYG